MIFNGKFRFILQLNPNLPQMKIKQLLLFVCLSSLTLSFTACSGDDVKTTDTQITEPSGTVSFKLDGVEKVYNTIIITESQYEEGATVRTITASQNGNPAELVEFVVVSGETGTNKLYNIRYVTNSVSTSNMELSSITTVSSNTALKATFSGLNYQQNANQEFVEVPVTDGVIDIQY